MADVTPSMRVTTPAPQAVVPQAAVTARPAAAATVEHVPLGQQIGNFGVGLRGLGKAWQARQLATEYDPCIAELAAAGDARGAAAVLAKQLEESDKRKARAKVVRDRVLKWCWPVLACGWPPFTMVFILLAAGAVWLAAKWKVLAPSKAQHAVLMAAASAGLTAVNVLAVVTWGDTSLRGLAWASRWYLLLPGLEVGILLVAVLAFFAWVWHAARIDATVADDIVGPVMMPADPPTATTTDATVITAILQSKAKLNDGTTLTPVLPGMIPLAGGKAWRLELDTGGPSAQPIVDAIDDIASRLNLDEASLIPQRRPGLGRRIILTGVREDPLAEPARSPLLDMPAVDIFEGIPFGRELTGERVTLPLAGRNYLIGGLPDLGKSTTGNPIHSAFCLSPRSKLWIIDGGRVDTAAIYRHGLAHRWVANDPEAALDVLRELNAYVDERQELLDEYGAAHTGFGKHVTPQMCEHYGIGPDLFWWDEFASHMACSDRALKRELRAEANSVLQRVRKLRIIAVLSTQSPSSIAIDTDGRDVISDRFALPCSTPEMAVKILGRDAVSAGANAARLPRIPGRGWLSGKEGNRIVRADYLDEHDLEAIYVRAVALRGTPADATHDVPGLLLAVAQLLASSEVESMRTIEVVDRLRAAGHDLPESVRGQQVLAAEMARHEVSPVAVRPDGNRSHYLAADVEAAVSRAARGAQSRLRLVKGAG